MRPRAPGSARAQRGGFALIAVLFVLIALLILCAPFLGTARNTNQAGMLMSERAELRLAQDAAERHARAVLGGSHPALDTTLDWDGPSELVVSTDFDPAFLDTRNPRDTIWDVVVDDVAGRIDLNSAGPHAIANMLGLATLLTEVVEAKATELEVGSTRGFGPEGYLWIDGELIHYGAIEDGRFLACTRGLGARYDDKGQPLPGPLPPKKHALGTPVLDQRVFALPLWRISGALPELRSFDAPEQLLEAEDLIIAGEQEQRGRFEGEEVQRLLALGSVHAGITAGREWQHPTRLVSPIIASETMSIAVSEPRWMTVGATLCIRDADTTELALVAGVQGSNILLDRLLEHDHHAFETEVSVLAKRPVNLNTASPAVLHALFSNLKLRSRNARVLDSHAKQLAALVVGMRPFRGMRDFLERLILPAAGLAEPPEGGHDAPFDPFLDPANALAVYANGLNANDAILEFATMPYSFVSREVYDLEVRASVNAESGVQRASGVRELTELIAPQKELFFLWSRQADYDEALRLDCEAPWWMTGPEATSRFDASTVPPSRLTPHFGTLEGASITASIFDPAARFDSSGTQLEHVFASEEPEGWCQLWPARHPEEQPKWQGRILHFDHETHDPEGRYLPDQVLRLEAQDPRVLWSEPDNPLLKPFTFEAWIRPRDLGRGTILDVGGTDPEVDRVSLVIEDEDLVLRVVDGFGDHKATPEREVAELRYSLGAGDSPGLPPDVWSHVAIDVRGNRPSQMTMLVNGLAYGVRTPGLTRLAGLLSQNAENIPVVSTDGFPERGVVKIGNELIEYVRDANGLSCLHQETGRYAGFGGRLARARFDQSGIPLELAETDVSHPPGTPVELYGYSLPLESNLPAGGSSLRSSLGSWRPARAIGVEGDGMPTGGDAITVGFAVLGTGIEGTQRRPAPFDILLADADDPFGGATEYMQAFQPEGGYAAIVQGRVVVIGTDNRTSFLAPINGIEVVRYSGWEENRLHIVERADVTHPKLRRLSQTSQDERDDLVAEREGRAFVVLWDAGVIFADGSSAMTRMDLGCYVLPISLSASGAGTFSGFLDPIAEGLDRSEHAQLTHTEDAENTEWVRYDEIVSGELVRSSRQALLDAYLALTLGGRVQFEPPPDDNLGGGGSGGGGEVDAPAPPPPPAPPAPPRAAQTGSQWVPTLGLPEDENRPLTRAVREALRFRGVMGTYSHAHPTGTPLLPVFRIRDAGVLQLTEDGQLSSSPDRALALGMPGSGDAVFVSGSELEHVGWPLVVQRSFRPHVLVQQNSWRQEGDTQVALASGGAFTSVDRDVFLDQAYVALQTTCPEPIAGSAVSTAAGSESRVLPRLSKFPSGELPRAVQSVGIGTSTVAGASSVPSLVIDEIVFGDPRFARGLPGASPVTSTQGSRLAVQQSFGVEDEVLIVVPTEVETALGRHGTPPVLDELVATGGLLRLGSEIVAYSGRDVDAGRITIARGGHGLLGTFQEHHQRGEGVTYLESQVAGILSVDIAAGDAQIPLSGAEGFPPQGTVLIGSELIHYTYIAGSALCMPRLSAEAGKMDGKGPGLFRGRYGSAAQGHLAGEAVILFPFRYWDRWLPFADAPELGYFGLQLNQPGAYWRDYFWEWEQSPTGGARLGVLVRSDPRVPWDADPETTEGLWVSYEGDREGQPLALGVQADRLEWRVFVQYDQGAFDPLSGRSHAWKTTPRLRRMGVDFLAPCRLLRSAER